MRAIVLASLALAGMSLTSTSAEAGTWCGTFRLGSTNCGYPSSEEAWPRCVALGDFATRTHFLGRPTAPLPGAGIARQGLQSTRHLLRASPIDATERERVRAQNGWDQYSTGRMLPCLIIISCGEIGADASVASSLLAIFGLANVDIDHAKAITATAAIAARIVRLRICHLLIPHELRSGIGILCADPV
jgi:hypothetical protein